MQSFPHRYSITASTSAGQDVTLVGKGLPVLISAPPVEFGGPGDRWSPETLLVAAVADCFVLTFRALAARSKLPWISLTAEVAGTLDRLERVTQFTQFLIHVRLRIAAGTTQDQAQRVLARAEESCLVSHSLKGVAHLETSIEIESPAVASDGTAEAA